MNILLIHNRYGKFSGEEAVVESQVELLTTKGHKVTLFERSSREIPGLKLKSVTAFFSGFHNSHSIRLLKDLLDEKQFDVAHIHNLYPLISPAVLPVLSARGIPVVMTVHNYRLVCPNGNFFRHGRVCEECSGGHECNCIIHNCENSALKSTGYALRNYYARIRRLYLDHVTLFATLTGFARTKLISNGFDPDRVTVLPNFTVPAAVPPGFSQRNYVAFAGRMTAEKGMDTLAAAATLIPDIPILLAGNPGPGIDPSSFAKNMVWKGMLSQEELGNFYRNARLFVLPSSWYEGFPMVLLDAMNNGIPMLGPRHGGFPEIIDDGVTGLLFEPGNPADLAEKIRQLWSDPERCNAMGTAGYHKLCERYSADLYYRRLFELYKNVISQNRQS